MLIRSTWALYKSVLHAVLFSKKTAGLEHLQSLVLKVSDSLSGRDLWTPVLVPSSLFRKPAVVVQKASCGVESCSLRSGGRGTGRV